MTSSAAAAVLSCRVVRNLPAAPHSDLLLLLFLLLTSASHQQPQGAAASVCSTLRLPAAPDPIAVGY